jgi:hypothetical protein
MLGFKVFRCARILIAGIGTMHMIRKGQIDCHDGKSYPPLISFIPWLSDRTHQRAVS